MSESKKCETCETEYVQCTYLVLGKEIILEVANCNCEEKRIAKQEEQKEKEALQEALNKRFKNSLITPYFQEKSFEKLEKSDATSFGIKYADEFKKTSKGIALIGKIGLGKTTLLACICNKLTEKGHNCLFITMAELLDKFIASCSFEAKESAEDLFYWLLKFDFIVLDDIGQESYTPKRKEFFFRIVDTLMKHKKVVGYTANIKLFNKLECDPEMEATIDRLKEMCTQKIVFEGESYRSDKE